MTFALKQYQQQSLAKLETYLQACLSMTPPEAFAHAITEHEPEAIIPTYTSRFGSQVPCVCLRVPTGGGKTLMAAHSVALAGRSLMHSQAPVALWLTPSDTIRKQTLEAFTNAQHPYRQALTTHFGDRVRICDLDSLQTIGPHDVGHSAILVVTTIQSLSVRKTTDRNVYSFFEALSPHFALLPTPVPQGLECVSAEDLTHQPYLNSQDVGRVKHSVANWLHLQQPIVIVDEAHNHQTAVFYNAIGRINPSCVIEFTATPVSGINVLHHVSAQQLKAEQMIKLLIVLTEHPQGWRECIHSARITRDRLEALAQNEPDYLRPIALIQAEDKNAEATVEAVRHFLEQDELIEKNQIAIVTGSQKELNGINLFDPQCPIRYVVTVEALKEGWDCSFAYVLASLQSVRSAKDVEQLLGRVLRMPYALNRQQDALNKAYAHIVAESFAEAAHNITDRLVNNMGFNPYEAANLFISQQFPLPLPDGQARAPRIPDCYIPLPAMPSPEVVATWPSEVSDVIDIRPTSHGAALLMPGNLNDSVYQQIQDCVSAPLNAAQKTALTAQFNLQRDIRAAQLAPAALGHTFAPIPQLCLPFEQHLEVVDRMMLSGMGQQNLQGSIQVTHVSITDSSQTFTIDLLDQGVKYTYQNASQLTLDNINTTGLTEEDLIRWLDREVRQPDVSQLQMQAWLVRMVSYLQTEKGFTLPQLVRGRFALVPGLLNELDRLRNLAVVEGFQQQLPSMTVADPHEVPYCAFRFDAGVYPASNLYRGSYHFTKHYYGAHLIHDLPERTATGKLKEEFLCAQAIDTCPQVKHWIRNIPKQEKSSFWLPTSTDYFYPDFVAELIDGRLLVIEYKGADRWSDDDSKEKRLIGRKWQDESQGKCLFLMAREKDDFGRDVAGQISEKVKTI